MSGIKLAYSTRRKSVYERFCAAHPELNISFDVWKTIISTLNSNYADYIIETGDVVQLFPGIGPHYIVKRKNQKYIECKTLGKTFIGLSTDWKKTRLAGKPVYHLNAHSDGLNYSWKWLRDKSKYLICPNLWYFTACRRSKRGLAAFAKLPESPAKHIYKEAPPRR
jgi:hypothetical protein